MKTNKRYLSFIVLIFSVALIAIDQFIKYAVEEALITPGASIPVWEDVFEITYIQNPGAAFGLFAGQSFLLIGLTGMILLVLVALIVLNKIKHPLLLWSLGCIIGGGIGNLIDRINLGYVIDYLNFPIINFAVFNFADCCVVVGTVLLVCYFIFIDGKEKQETPSLEVIEEPVTEALTEEALEETTEEISAEEEKRNEIDAILNEVKGMTQTEIDIPSQTTEEEPQKEV